MFKTSFPRPKKLSDPYGDFTPAELDKVLKTPDEKFGWLDYRYIFQVGLPGASFEEGAYFLPNAFKFMRDHPKESADCISDVLWFVSHHEEQLNKTLLYQPSRDAIAEVFGTWTQTFKVTHYDKKACLAKGWNREYFNYVENSDSVSSWIDTLCRYNQSELADDLISTLSTLFCAADKSAWFLEYARHLSEQYEFYDSTRSKQPLNLHQMLSDSSIQELGTSREQMKQQEDLIYEFMKNSPPDMTPTRGAAKIDTLVFNQNLRAQHFKTVQASTLINAQTESYWKDVEQMLFSKPKI